MTQKFVLVWNTNTRTESTIFNPNTQARHEPQPRRPLQQSQLSWELGPADTEQTTFDPWLVRSPVTTNHALKPINRVQYLRPQPARRRNNPRERPKLHALTRFTTCARISLPQRHVSRVQMLTPSAHTTSMAQLGSDFCSVALTAQKQVIRHIFHYFIRIPTFVSPGAQFDLN